MLYTYIKTSINEIKFALLKYKEGKKQKIKKYKKNKKIKNEYG